MNSSDYLLIECVAVDRLDELRRARQAARDSLDPMSVVAGTLDVAAALRARPRAIDRDIGDRMLRPQ